VVVGCPQAPTTPQQGHPPAPADHSPFGMGHGQRLPGISVRDQPL